MAGLLRAWADSQCAGQPGSPRWWHLCVGEGQISESVAEACGSASEGDPDVHGGRLQGDATTVFSFYVFHLVRWTNDTALLDELWPNVRHAVNFTMSNAASTPAGLPYQMDPMWDILALANIDYVLYGPLNYRTAARTLFLRPYLAHFCSCFRRFFAVLSVLTPGFQKVALEDRGPVPQRSKTAAKRVVAADLFLVDRYNAVWYLVSLQSAERLALIQGDASFAAMCAAEADAVRTRIDETFWEEDEQRWRPINDSKVGRPNWLMADDFLAYIHGTTAGLPLALNATRVRSHLENERRRNLSPFGVRSLTCAAPDTKPCDHDPAFLKLHGLESHETARIAALYSAPTAAPRFRRGSIGLRRFGATEPVTQPAKCMPDPYMATLADHTLTGSPLATIAIPGSNMSACQQQCCELQVRNNSRACVAAALTGSRCELFGDASATFGTDESKQELVSRPGTTLAWVMWATPTPGDCPRMNGDPATCSKFCNANCRTEGTKCLHTHPPSPCGAPQDATFQHGTHDAIWGMTTPDLATSSLRYGAVTNASEALDLMAGYFQNTRVSLRDQWNWAAVTATESTGDGPGGQPWCSSHYFFHLSVWHVPLALSGQNFSAMDGTLAFAPKLEAPLALPVLVSGAIGTLTISEQGAGKLHLTAGRIRLHRIEVHGQSAWSSPTAVVVKSGEAIEWTQNNRFKSDDDFSCHWGIVVGPDGLRTLNPSIRSRFVFDHYLIGSYWDSANGWHFPTEEVGGLSALFMNSCPTRRAVAAPNFTAWQSNYARCMQEHLSTLPHLLKSGATGWQGQGGIPHNWSGLVVYDWEDWGPEWADETWSLNVRFWRSFVANISEPAFDDAFLSAVGFVAPSSASGWAELTASEQNALLSTSYEHFAKEFFLRTLDASKALRPNAKFGLFGFPLAAENGTARPTNFPPFGRGETWESRNDRLGWLWRALDVYLPSLYGAGWVSDTGSADNPCGEVYGSAENLRYLRSNLVEARRLRDAFGSAQPILPYWWQHYNDGATKACRNRVNVWVNGLDIQQHFQTATELADGMVLWGAPLSKSFRGWQPDQVNRTLSDLASNWAPYIERHCDSQPAPPSLPVYRTCHAKDFGVVGDGVADDTASIDSMLTTCKLNSRLVLPSGRYRLSKHLLLDRATNVDVVLDGQLLAPLSSAAWMTQAGGSPEHVLVQLINCSNVTIRSASGVGSIEGRADMGWWQRKANHSVDTPSALLVKVTGGRDITLRNVTLRNAPSWHLAIANVSGVLLEGVSIVADKPVERFNTRNVGGLSILNPSGVLFHVAGCRIISGDDNIEISSVSTAEDPNVPRRFELTRNVLVEDTYFGDGHGASMHTGQDIVYRRCIFNGTGNGVRIKATPFHGGTASNITYEDLRMIDVGTPIFVDLDYGGDGNLPKESSTPTLVHSIRFKNIDATSWGQYGKGGIIRCGFSGAPGCSNMTLTNVSIRPSASCAPTPYEPRKPYCGQVEWECIRASGIASGVVPSFGAAPAPAPPGEPRSSGCALKTPGEQANQRLKLDDAEVVARAAPADPRTTREISVDIVQLWWNYAGNQDTPADGHRAMKDAANRGLRYFRFAASLFYPIDMNSTYATNPDEYWRKFDVMISDAEALNVSLIPSISWNLGLFPNLINLRAGNNLSLPSIEPLARIFVPGSVSNKALQAYTTAMVRRYQHSNAIFFWELGNEWDLGVDLDMSNGCCNRSGPISLGVPLFNTQADNYSTSDMARLQVQMAGWIRSADSRGRLVGTGHGGPRASATYLRTHYHEPFQATTPWPADTLAEYKQTVALQGAGCDILSFHYYGDSFCDNTSGLSGTPTFGCDNSTAPAPSNPPRPAPGSAAMLPFMASAAHAANKLMHIGEFGTHRATVEGRRFSLALIDGLGKLGKADPQGAVLANMWVWEYKYGGNDSIDPRYNYTGDTSVIRRLQSVNKALGELHHDSSSAASLHLKSDDCEDKASEVERLRVELAEARSEIRRLRQGEALRLRLPATYADDVAMRCWLNESVASCPNPLAGLKRLPKPHHSWPISYGGSVTANFSKSPVVRDFARITWSIPIDLNFHAAKNKHDPPCWAAPSDKQLEASVKEAVRLCADEAINCSLTANYSPFRSGRCTKQFWNCTNASSCDWGNCFKDELECYNRSLQTVDGYIQEENKALGSAVKVTAVLFDQEYFGVHFAFEDPGSNEGFGDLRYRLVSSRAQIDSANKANNAVYDATLRVWPGATIDQYQRGSIWQTMGDGTKGCGPHDCSWASRAHGLWCGTTAGFGRDLAKKGEGNEDVVPCGQSYYSLEEKGTAFSTNLYSVGGGMQVMREAFNRTVNSARAAGLSPPLVTPWVWLGGGTKRVVANYGGGANDDKWNYELIDSWTLGLELNQKYYGERPMRFSQWGAAARVAFYPSVFGRDVPRDPKPGVVSQHLGMQRTPCGICNVRLQHFVAYVRGAANETLLAGPEPGLASVSHACECLVNGTGEPAQWLLARDAYLKSDDDVEVVGPAADRVHSLPGFAGTLPSPQYSGYVRVGPVGHRRFLHYWLQMSETTPATDPVVLWLNGGPGASSIMYGALTEMGQFLLNSRSLRENKTAVPLLAHNPHSWSRKASVIYLESPAGVGFSYCDYSPCTANDTTTAEDSYDFLVGFFRKFPQLKQNSFYVTGESYAGIYAPTLAAQIVQRGGINLQGLMVGNGCWGNQVGTCSNALWVGDQQRIIVDFLSGHGLISKALYRTVAPACNFSWSGNKEPDAECMDALMACHNQSGVRLHAPTYNVYDFCRSGIGANGWAPPRPPRQSELLAGLWRGSRLAQRPRNQLAPPAPAGGDEQLWCGAADASLVWLAMPSVAAAMHLNLTNGCDVPALSGSRHLRSTPMKCLDSYTRAPAGDLRPLYASLARKFPLLLYSGDADACVPFVGTEEWVSELGFPVAEPWRPWLATANGSGPVGRNGTDHIFLPHGPEAQRVGYVTTFGGAAKRLTFATVNGAGHEVPMFKPVAAAAMLDRFLAGRAL